MPRKFKSFTDGFEYLSKTIEKTQEQSGPLIAENIVRNSNEGLVPIETGALRKSGIKNKALWKESKGRWDALPKKGNSTVSYARNRYFSNRTGVPLWIQVELRRNRKLYENIVVKIFTKNK